MKMSRDVERRRLYFRGGRIVGLLGKREMWRGLFCLGEGVSLEGDKRGRGARTCLPIMPIQAIEGVDIFQLLVRWVHV